MDTLDKEWTKRFERIREEPRVFLDVSNTDGLKSHLRHAKLAQANYDEAFRFRRGCHMLGEILQEKLSGLWGLFLRCLPDDAPEKIKLAEMKAERARLAEQAKLAAEAKEAADAALANFERGYDNAKKYGLGL
jgi:folylpolyglutamate synthase/dihydropteroate synthase